MKKVEDYMYVRDMDSGMGSNALKEYLNTNTFGKSKANRICL